MGGGGGGGGCCCLFVCLSFRHNSSLVCMVRITYVYLDTAFGFFEHFFFLTPIFTAPLYI